MRGCLEAAARASRLYAHFTASDLNSRSEVLLYRDENDLPGSKISKLLGAIRDGIGI